MHKVKQYAAKCDASLCIMQRFTLHISSLVVEFVSHDVEQTFHDVKYTSLVVEQSLHIPL